MSNRREYIIDMNVEQFIEFLSQQYPAKCIGQDESLTDAHRRAGKRELIDTLRTRIKQEKEKYVPTTQI